jgi:hypothetical protein
LPELLTHLVSFHGLFRRQQLIELRMGLRANRDELSQQPTLFRGELSNFAFAVASFRCGSKRSSATGERF